MRTPPCRFLSLVTMAFLAGCMHAGKEAPKPPLVPVSAEVRRQFDAAGNPMVDGKGNWVRQTTTVTDAARAAKLASYLPGLGTDWKTPTAAGYIAWVDIEFTGADGRRAHVVSDYALWSEGHGDKNVVSGFATYVDSLFAGSPSSGAADQRPAANPGFGKSTRKD